MDKILYINEIHKDFRVKDSKTFPNDRAKELKRMTSGNIQLEDDKAPQLCRFKVKSVTDKKMTLIDKSNIKDYLAVMRKEDREGLEVGDWAFTCQVKIKLFD